ncbi:hypothetical protein B4168_0461 [Anoxybacillus flavithermus]|nr:hypothetical protein B4168_0461 [Anoxybacillus flavithermus]OAO87114.1 hypothetical protein GT23_1457 [Parageobacillus thermoglucosidasius]
MFICTIRSAVQPRNTIPNQNFAPSEEALHYLGRFAKSDG